MPFNEAYETGYVERDLLGSGRVHGTKGGWSCSWSWGLVEQRYQAVLEILNQ